VIFVALAFLKICWWISQGFVSCPSCGRRVWWGDINPEGGMGQTARACRCGVLFATTDREWDEFTEAKKRRYVFGESLEFSAVTIVFMAVLGYLARWNDQPWVTALVFAIFGFGLSVLSMIPIATARVIRIRMSIRKARLALSR
jgi:hypothetical protein